MPVRSSRSSTASSPINASRSKRLYRSFLQLNQFRRPGFPSAGKCSRRIRSKSSVPKRRAGRRCRTPPGRWSARCRCRCRRPCAWRPRPRTRVVRGAEPVGGQHALALDPRGDVAVVVARGRERVLHAVLDDLGDVEQPSVRRPHGDGGEVAGELEELVVEVAAGGDDVAGRPAGGLEPARSSRVPSGNGTSHRKTQEARILAAFTAAVEVARLAGGLVAPSAASASGTSRRPSRS